DYIDPVTRKYNWRFKNKPGWHHVVQQLCPRPDRWDGYTGVSNGTTGTFGIYSANPGPLEFLGLKPYFISDEGEWHGKSREALSSLLRNNAKTFDSAYTNSGFLVGFRGSSRSASIVLYQFKVAGAKPIDLAGANDAAIRIKPTQSLL